ncbi:MAG TPA: hypothetical protein VJS66_06280 [Burkholderiales bacterium]|nr:hypothetical protein [Burkholderiales bacterium]
MTRAKWTEIGAIVTASIGSAMLPLDLFSELTPGEIVLYLSGLLLAQGLVRDLILLLRNRGAAHGGVFKESQCLCLESAIGTIGVVVGACLFMSSTATPVTVTGLGVAVGMALTLTIGLLIKDLVIVWNPLGIRREKNPLGTIIRSPRE